jgi:predicted kinase
MLKLHLIRGLPGSGKSTFAINLAANTPNTYHLEADQFVPQGPNGEYLYKKEDAGFYHAQCLSSTFSSLILGINCIVSNTFIQYWEIAPYIDIANRAKAKLFIHICRGEYKTIHPVPPEVIQLMKERWEE